MRYALLACIHGNLAALEAVLRDVEQLGCESIYCLGDIVGFFEHARECVDLVRSRCEASVKGNYDDYCSESFPLVDFNERAAAMIDWTRRTLSAAGKAWLRELSYQRQIGECTIVHAGLCAPERWEYIFDKIAAEKHFAHQKTSLCFSGHTHVPTVFRRKNGVVAGGRYTRFAIKPNTKYLVNVGSVGQPRDGTTQAAYVVYDANTRTVELRQVDYRTPPPGGYGAGKPNPAGGKPPTLLVGTDDVSGG